MEIDKIIVRDRFRTDMGDLEALASSIAAHGLLQPIGVTENNELVFGERRLRACRDILGMTDIDVRVVNVTSIIEGERDENEIRKDFTVSERVAIGKAIEERLGSRRGQRTDKQLPANLPEVQGEQLRENFPQVAKGQKTRQVAATAAGFGNDRTYEAAKKVIAKAVPGVLEALDKGDLSVAAAALVVDQPEEEQSRFVSVPKSQQREAVKMYRNAQRAGKEPTVHRVQLVFEGFRLIAETEITLTEFMENVLPAGLQDMKGFAPRVRKFLEAVERASHVSARAS